MSLHEYKNSQKASNEYDFYSLIMAKLKVTQDRCSAPGGVIK